MAIFKKLPKKIKVGRHSYSVKYMEEIEEGKLLGVCYLDDKRIEVAMEKGQREAESTILHEMLHAISEEYDLNLSEKRVIQLEKGLFETLERNGWKITK